MWGQIATFCIVTAVFAGARVGWFGDYELDLYNASGCGNTFCYETIQGNNPFMDYVSVIGSSLSEFNNKKTEIDRTTFCSIRPMRIKIHNG